MPRRNAIRPRAPTAARFVFPLCVSHRGSALLGLDVGLDSFEGASAVCAHDGVAVDVVPDSAHGLLECLSASALPFVVVTPEVVSQEFTTRGIEQMAAA